MNYKFVEIKEEELDKFVSNSNQSHFMQTSYMKKYYDLKNKENYILGVKENDKLVASFIIVLESTFKKYKKFAIYKGFVLDYNNKELLKFVTDNVVNFLKDKNCYMFTIDPNIIEIERDTFANVIENGENNYDVINELTKLGYRKSEKDVQIKWTYVLDIKERTSDELFKTFKQNTRNIISRTVNKFKLNIRTISYEELDDFKKITEDTCIRRNFQDKSLTYYQNMLKAFKDKVVFKIAELNCDTYLSSLLEEKQDYENKIEKIKGSNKKKDNYLQELNYINKKIEDLTKLKNEKGNIIPLSCAMFVLTNKEIFYLSSGSYEEYMQYYGQYIIQWDMIKYACDNDYNRYNFYGIMDVFDKNGKDYGVYEFKKGFNGYVRELLGEYTYIIDSKVYKRHQVLSKIKKILFK